MILNINACMVYTLTLLMLLPDYQSDNITIHLIGDSTMAEKDGTAEQNPERGWGQVLSQYFDSAVTVKNYAKNGRSSRSFISEGRWKEVYDNLQEGDFVLIQFGHNDQKINDPSRYSNPSGGYYHNLKKFVDEARIKGGTPILLTSIVRRKFNEFGTLEDTHGLYPIIVRQLATDEEVLLIDHLYLTEKIVAEMGPEESKKIYLWVQPGQFEKFPEGKEDDTHLNLDGANLYSKLVATELKKFKTTLKNHINIK